MLFQELALQFPETGCTFEETDRVLGNRSQAPGDERLDHRPVGQTGGSAEAARLAGTVPACGIPVNAVPQRDQVRRDGREMEIGVTLIDGDVAIPVEVKTALTVADVQEFLDRMREFSFFFPKYRDCRIHGAVAAVRIAKPTGKVCWC